MSTLSSQKTLDDLFPPPSPPPSALAPTRAFGVTAESGETLTRLLKDNHERWHIYFNSKGFHNHASHHLLANYALGAPAPLLEAAYGTHTVYQRPMFGSDEPVINANNFKDYLGNQQYYRNYLKFFTQLVLTRDPGSILEEFIFSEAYNFDSARDGRQQPEMVNRFLAGLMHPVIHVGYGLEFGLKGILAEGLAQTVIHRASAAGLLSRSTLFDFAAKGSTVEHITSRLPSLSLSSSSASNATDSSSGPHLFGVLSRIVTDKRLDTGALGLTETDDKYDRVISTGSDIIREHVGEWTFDAHDPEVVKSKVEELFWAQVLLYGVGGWRENKGFQADFFLMHLATSVLFLPSILPYLSPPSQRTLLRTYLAVSLAWWVARGRPGFSIDAFYDDTTSTPVPPGPPPTPGEGSLAGVKAETGAELNPLLVAPNPWFALLQTTLLHPNEHLPKLQRALAHGASLYGARPRGYWKDTGLSGAERLDGTLFIRVAGLTADRLGWVREGQEGKRHWDREGFF